MARYFFRLKLTLIASSFRRGWQHALGLVSGLAIGVPMAFGGAIALALGAQVEVGTHVLVLVFAVLAVGWTVAPVLFFGLDETLDPARLRLLPLSRRQLLTGLTVAGATGVPAVATLVVLLSGLAHAPGPALVPVVALAVAAQFLVCLWAGRALATALSATLRSRKGRDLAAGAAVLVGIAFAAAGQIPNLLANVFDGDDGLERFGALVETAAGVVALTPPGWAGGAILAAGDGRYLASLGLLAAAIGLAAALAWAWQAALERTLSQPDTVSSGKAKDQPLFPAALAWLPRSQTGATAAKELRYLLRVPQTRIGLALLAVLAAGLVVATVLAEPLSRPEIVYAPVLLVAVQGFQSINLFGHDRGAVWLLVASGSTYRGDLAGKGVAHALAVLPVAIAASAALAAVTGAWTQLLPAALLAVALQLSAHGVGAVASVLAPHPMPEDASNLWGSSAGMGCATMFMQFVAFMVQGLLLAPAAGAVVAAYFLAPAWLPLAGLLVAAYGAAIWLAGVVLAAARLEARAPEFVAALSAEPAR